MERTRPTRNGLNTLFSTSFVYSRIDYFLINTSEIHRLTECKIGVAEISDHSGISLTIHLNNKKINTAWRLNVGILNNMANVEQIKEEVKRYI